MKRIAYINTSIGHSAKVYRDVDWNEYRVKFYNPEGQHLTNADYHTDDKEDALSTAHAQLKQLKANKEQD